ncbi:MAG TPA: ATP-dependent helicase, partial [Opitutales bacterium]|nr:ATP-dependent helicase [Opitutales bacterium]
RTYCQKRFHQVLVDEYQDTNKLQSEIVDLIAADHQLMAVGDDAQCIYTWRGANFDNIRRFPERHPGAQIFKIEINYRSTPEVLRFANGILDHQHVAAGFHKHLRPVRKMGRKPIVIAALDTRQQAAFVIARIRELRDNEDIALRDIAVLYRAHYQAMDLQIELSRTALPFTITSGVRFFEQAHVRDLTAHLRFAHNPRDTVAFTRLASLLPKVGPRKAEGALAAAQHAARADGKTLIAALTDDAVAAKLPAEARADFKDLALTLQNLEEALIQLNAAQLHPGEPPATNAFPAAIQGNLFAADRKNPKPETRNSKTLIAPADVVRIAIEGWYGDYIRNIYDNWESRREDLDSVIGFASRFQDMNELLSQLVLLNSETSDRSVDPDADTIRLTTIHQAKGLEFPVVFIIGVADGLLPLKRAIDSGDIEEERRLFYVAATRAKDELYVLYPRIVSQNGPPAVLEPSRFLDELDPESFDQFKAKPGLY